jgi:hypothetical protein
MIPLSDEDDPTQSKNDVPRYEGLSHRLVKVINLGQPGYIAALSDPDTYAALLERRLNSADGVLPSAYIAAH